MLIKLAGSKSVVVVDILLTFLAICVHYEEYKLARIFQKIRELVYSVYIDYKSQCIRETFITSLIELLKACAYVKKYELYFAILKQTKDGYNLKFIDIRECLNDVLQGVIDDSDTDDQAKKDFQEENRKIIEYLERDNQ